MGNDVPKTYKEQVIAEANVKQDQRVTYEDFLDMWRKEIEDRKLNAYRGISKQRTVSVLADELFASSEDDDSSSEDGNDDQPLSARLVSIVEIEEYKSKSFSSKADC